MNHPTAWNNLWVACLALAQAAQGSAGDTIPAGISETCRCGTQGQGLGLGGHAGLTMVLISEVFSNMNNFMILWAENDFRNMSTASEREK